MDDFSGSSREINGEIEFLGSQVNFTPAKADRVSGQVNFSVIHDKDLGIRLIHFDDLRQLHACC